MLFWSRSKRPEYPVPVHMLVSSKSWHCGLLAAISLEINSEKNWRFVIHEDGSVTEPQRRRIQKTLPGVRFISRPEAEERLQDELQHFPLSLKHRARHNFFLKFFDAPPFVDSPKFIVLDSDVIFFRRPEEIIRWSEEASDSIYYNEDTQEKYCNPRADLEDAMGFEIWRKFNSGLVLMQSAAMNNELAETLLAKFENSAHHPQFFEQTLFCVMSSAWGRGGALPKQYEINWGYLKSRGAVCRHYVGAFKHDLLYIEGASFLFLRLLPSLIKNAVTSGFANFGKTTRVLALSALIFGLTVFGWQYFKTNEGVLKLQQTILGLPFRAIETRDGIPRFTAKLSKGAPVTIAFIGGSITQNAGEGGFVTTLKKHLTSEFPTSDIRIINAGMASTDSAWGAKRIGRDVLESKPDLVFVEFAVNDGERDSAPDMERIVRKIHDSNPEAEVVFIYTTSESALKKLRKSVFPKAILEHEKVANHYGIPSVVFGADLVSLITSGQWKWRDFSNDACHPTKQGYESYNRDFLSAFGRILKESRSKGSEQYPEPIFNNLELYPPKITPEPVAKKDSLLDGNGNLVNQTERMPVWGSQWIDEPFFESSTGSVWKLEYAVYSAMPNRTEASASMINWKPARWFEEAGVFTGERSRILAGGNSTLSELWIPPHISPGSVELPRIIWSSGQSGNCLVDFSINAIEGHINSPPALAGFDLLVQRSAGELEYMASISGEEGQALRLRNPVSLAKGDAIILIPFAKGYEFLKFEGLDLVIGFFENPPTP